MVGNLTSKKLWTNDYFKVTSWLNYVELIVKMGFLSGNLRLCYGVSWMIYLKFTVENMVLFHDVFVKNTRWSPRMLLWSPHLMELKNHIFSTRIAMDINGQNADPLVNKHSYWKWPIYSGLMWVVPLKMVIFHSYVNVYQRVVCIFTRIPQSTNDDW